jgi:hypothetical protein
MGREQKVEKVKGVLVAEAFRLLVLLVGHDSSLG